MTVELWMFKTRALQHVADFWKSSQMKGSTQDSEILLSYSCLRVKVAQHAEARLSAYLKTEGSAKAERDSCQRHPADPVAIAASPPIHAFAIHGYGFGKFKSYKSQKLLLIQATHDDRRGVISEYPRQDHMKPLHHDTSHASRQQSKPNSTVFCMFVRIHG